MAQSLLELCLMELGIEQNALTMHVLERQQDVIAHNLACNTVAGYQGADRSGDRCAGSSSEVS